MKSMYVRDFGAGEVVLLLHGTPSPADDWRPLVDALVPGHRVVVPDLPGYGNSADPPDVSMEEIGNSIAAMLAQRGIRRLRAAVGFSSGAYRVFDLVLRHAIPADLIVSLGGVASFDAPSRALRRGFAARLREDPSYLTSEEARQAMRALMLSARWADTHPSDVERIAAWPRTTTASALAAELDALAVSRDLRPELHAIRCPVYARVGDLDAGCPPAWSEDLVRCVPRGELELVPGVGHTLMIEDVAGTVEAVHRRVLAAGAPHG